MKDIIFNPCFKKCKSPTGASYIDDVININISIIKNYNLYDVRLVMKDDNNNVIFKKSLKREEEDIHYNNYFTSFEISECGLYWYYFEFDDVFGTHFISSSSSLDAFLTDYLPISYQLLVVNHYKGNLNWFKGKIMYQIMVDRFFNSKGKKTRDDAHYHENWNDTPFYLPDENGKYRNDFFGGDLNGITKKLDYLKSLNVSIIYLNPIFEAYSNHKYDTGNYMKIDSMFGDEKDLKELINRANDRGISIILDGVFNHTGDDSVYFNRYHKYDDIGAFESKESKYYDWYCFDEYPNKYKSWWGFDNLPSVNQRNESYLKFITGENGVISKWLTLGIRGFRFDVVDELEDHFIERIGERLKSINNENIMIGEVWEDASCKVAYGHRRSYFNGNQLDSVMNYPLKNAIIDFVKNGDSKIIQNVMRNLVNNYPKHILDNLMNILSTHDTIRLINNFSYLNVNDLKKEEQYRHLMTPVEKEKAIIKIKMATLLEYTLPGVPTVYYGDEAGLEGWSDPFCRKTFPWDNINKEINEWYKALGLLRENDVFIDGIYQEEVINGGLFSFSRIKDDKKITIIINNTDNDYEYKINKAFDYIENKDNLNNILVKRQDVKVLIIN